MDMHEASHKKLYRSREDKVIAGVCGGIGTYFSIDPTVIRLLWLFALLVGGSGFLIYVILWIIIPEEPMVENVPSEPVPPESGPYQPS